MIGFYEVFKWVAMIVTPFIVIAYYIVLIVDFPCVETRKEYLKYILIPFYMWYVEFKEKWNEIK